MGRIVLKQVRKRFGDREVVKGIDLAIEDGSFVVFVGPSGCGKTTLLRLIAGLEDVSGGQILIDDHDATMTPSAARELAMVFQSYALYPHMTVRKNIGFPLKMANRARGEIDRQVESVAASLNLTDCLDRKPKELSGGQRQRVAIGRAIVREPKAFLFDEPLSNLDAALRIQMRLELTALQKKLGTTAIYVTHDQVEAMTMADTIVVLNEGRVEQAGTPMQLYDRPVNMFVAGFIGSPKMNFISGDVARHYGASTIGIRPEHLKLAESAQGWDARVRAVEHLGSETYVYLTIPSIGELTMRCSGHSRFERDATIQIHPQSNRIHRFKENGSAIEPTIENR